jgi:polyisoprenoid-binding protein YceI
MLLSLSLLFACSTEIDNKPAAQVTPTPAKEAPATPAETPAGDTLPIKAEGSSVGFVGAKVTGSHDGGFSSFQGGLTVSEGQPVATTVTINMISAFADQPKLTKHLQSGDFFDVAQFATASFTSSSIAAGDAGFTVTGALDFHGVSNEVTFPATIVLTDGSATAKAEFTIDRQQWGVAYPGKKDDLIKDDVLIKLDLVFGS